MLSRTLTVATLLFVIGATVATTTPVFLWGANSLSKPALKTVSQEEFAEDVAAPLLKNNMVVVFLEDNLSSEDFGCSNAESSSSCYAHLQGVSPKTYYASVEKPIGALLSVATESEYNGVNEVGKLETPLECAVGKVVFVNLGSASQGERASALESHDAAIYAITKDITCPAAYMYMSTQNNAVKQRKRREAALTGVALSDTAAPLGGILFRDHENGGKFLIFYTKFYFISSNASSASSPPTKTEIVLTDITTTDGPGTVNTPPTYFTVKLATNDSKTVEFNITSNSGYFLLGNVLYDGVYYRTTAEFSAPYSFSFACGNLTLAAIPPSATETNSNRLSWEYLQFQAPFSTTPNATFVFGDSWSCTGFFTPGILMGLFVTLIMLIIMFTGICWMMDINTMDRFDDPKGKTITINAGE